MLQFVSAIGTIFGAGTHSCELQANIAPHSFQAIALQYTIIRRALFLLSHFYSVSSVQLLTSMTIMRCSVAGTACTLLLAVQHAFSLSTSTPPRKTAVLICPAQFCVPVDYEDLITSLQKGVHVHAEEVETEITTARSIATCKVAKLPRTEWIKVARHLPSKDFFESTLKPDKTLDWYFQAMESALADIYAAEGENVSISIIGHSIGGWVARAYLGGLSGSYTSVYRLTQERCSSLVTLGTPHSSPSEALVDQTRGLLRAVEDTPACSALALMDRGIDVTCVGSTSIDGKVFSTDIEELVASSSYIPLLGKLALSSGPSKGDGIVPVDLAFMDAPARRIEIEKCNAGSKVRHAHVFPTPWNLWDGYAASLPLPDDFTWYGSDSVIESWSSYVR